LFILKNTGEAVEVLRDILKSGECFLIKDLAVKGDDLIKQGIKPGREMGQMLEALLDIVMREPEMNEFERLIRIFPNGHS
jgi:tRNA nucleotidyltransferase (CCA-adding enzyme)